MPSSSSLLRRSLFWCEALALVLGAGAASAAESRTTLYLDGARIELTAMARKGVASVTLPASMVVGSLRVEPLKGAVIDRVQLSAPPVPKDAQRERRSLDARRELLEDRLAALTVKEEVFKSAAKSQSGRAPKRTKTNPEPLATIRQGTDYAVAQLEAVYRSRRVAERDLGQVKKKLAALAGDPAAVGSVARIAVHGGDQLRVSYLVREQRWSPSYDLHLTGESIGQLTVRGAGGAAVVPATIVAAGTAKELPVGTDGVVARLRCNVIREEHGGGAQPTIRAEIACPDALPLPGGPADCYARGNYLGTVALPAIVPGSSLPVVCGAFTGVGGAPPAPTVK